MFKILSLNKPKAPFTVLALAIATVMGVLIFQLTVSAPQVYAAPPLPDGPDRGVAALKNAIVAANISPNPTTITLAKNGTYDLTGGTLNITSNVNINGRGSTINGNDSFRIFFVGTVGDLTLKDLTVSGGRGSTGGGIHIRDGSLTMTHSTISGNTANFGGGILSFNGSLTMTHSTISSNTADFGGGIYTGNGSLTMTHSTISGNTAGDGGGIYNDDGTLHISSSTISGNIAGAGGGQRRRHLQPRHARH